MSRVHFAFCSGKVPKHENAHPLVKESPQSLRTPTSPRGQLADGIIRLAIGADDFRPTWRSSEPTARTIQTPVLRSVAGTRCCAAVVQVPHTGRGSRERRARTAGACLVY